MSNTDEKLATEKSSLEPLNNSLKARSAEADEGGKFEVKEKQLAARGRIQGLATYSRGRGI